MAGPRARLRRHTGVRCLRAGLCNGPGDAERARAAGVLVFGRGRRRAGGDGHRVVVGRRLWWG
eukprot:6303506-Pyramimonas_sp.AAC.1